MGETKRLFLLRHAKSSWDDPGLADHDRPLAPRGRKAAKRIGEHLREDRTEISLVLCSSAERARQTLELVQPPGEMEIEPGLYGASALQLLNRLRRVPEPAQAVMLIGHNPAIQDLAVGLVGAGSGQKFPTGGLASIAFAGPWRDLEWGRAELLSFVTPRALG